MASESKYYSSWSLEQFLTRLDDAIIQHLSTHATPSPSSPHTLPQYIHGAPLDNKDEIRAAMIKMRNEYAFLSRDDTPNRECIDRLQPAAALANDLDMFAFIAPPVGLSHCQLRARHGDDEEESDILQGLPPPDWLEEEFTTTTAAAQEEFQLTKIKNDDILHEDPNVLIGDLWWGLGIDKGYWDQDKPITYLLRIPQYQQLINTKTALPFQFVGDDDDDELPFWNKYPMDTEEQVFFPSEDDDDNENDNDGSRPNPNHYSILEVALITGHTRALNALYRLGFTENITRVYQTLTPLQQMSAQIRIFSRCCGEMRIRAHPDDPNYEEPSEIDYSALFQTFMMNTCGGDFSLFQRDTEFWSEHNLPNLEYGNVFLPVHMALDSCAVEIAELLYQNGCQCPLWIEDSTYWYENHNDYCSAQVQQDDDIQGDDEGSDNCADQDQGVNDEEDGQDEDNDEDNDDNDKGTDEKEGPTTFCQSPITLFHFILTSQPRIESDVARWRGLFDFVLQLPGATELLQEEFVRNQQLQHLSKQQYQLQQQIPNPIESSSNLVINTNSHLSIPLAEGVSTPPPLCKLATKPTLSPHPTLIPPPPPTKREAVHPITDLFVDAFLRGNWAALEVLWERGFRFPTIDIPLDEFIYRATYGSDAFSHRYFIPTMGWLINKAGEVGGDGLGSVLELDFNRYWTNSLKTTSPPRFDSMAPYYGGAISRFYLNNSVGFMAKTPSNFWSVLKRVGEVNEQFLKKQTEQHQQQHTTSSSSSPSPSPRPYRIKPINYNCREDAMSFLPLDTQLENREKQIQTPVPRRRSPQVRLMNFSTPLMEAIFAQYCVDFKRESSVNNMTWIIEGVIQDIISGYFGPNTATTDDDNTNNTNSIDTSQPLYPPKSWIVVGPKPVSKE